MSPSTNLVSESLPTEVDVLIVGAGLAGLACARLLTLSGINTHIIEASSSVGGRVKTDEMNGFLLDRGFQVLLTSYSELKNQVDLEQLDLRAFKSGSLIRSQDQFHLLSDPIKHPSDLMSTVQARVGSLSDKTKTAILKYRLLSLRPDKCFDGPERTTLSELERLGFSQRFIDTFFRPFLGGVYLEKSLNTSSSLFNYYLRCFSSGETTLPSGGMQRLPELLAQDLEGRVTFNTIATHIDKGKVTVQNGQVVKAREVVLAVDEPAAAKLTKSPVNPFKSSVTAYFSTDYPPSRDPILILNGENDGPVNHVAILSNVCPSYAPEGMHLISVSGVDMNANEIKEFPREALKQLRQWFGPTVENWSYLHTYFIPFALPKHPPQTLPDLKALNLRYDNFVRIGDSTTFGSIQGALLSGRKGAELILEQLD